MQAFFILRFRARCHRSSLQTLSVHDSAMIMPMPSKNVHCSYHCSVIPNHFRECSYAHRIRVNRTSFLHVYRRSDSVRIVTAQVGVVSRSLGRDRVRVVCLEHGNSEDTGSETEELSAHGWEDGGTSVWLDGWGSSGDSGAVRWGLHLTI